MTNPILVLECNYHFGDNLGIFGEACFVGLTLQLPVVVTWISNDPSIGEVFLCLETHDIETWDSQPGLGHQVLLNGAEIGRLKDPDAAMGRIETFKLSVDKTALEQLIGPLPANAILSILLERQPKHPTLADDFVLTRIETIDMAMRVGSV